MKTKRRISNDKVTKMWSKAMYRQFIGNLHNTTELEMLINLKIHLIDTTIRLVKNRMIVLVEQIQENR